MDAHSAHYGAPMGNETSPPCDRQLLAIRALGPLRRQSQIMIVNGSQQALEITARVLLDPGARVWIEEPCYRLARSIFQLTAVSRSGVRR